MLKDLWELLKGFCRILGIFCVSTDHVSWIETLAIYDVHRLRREKFENRSVERRFARTLLLISTRTSLQIVSREIDHGVGSEGEIPVNVDLRFALYDEMDTENDPPNPRNQPQRELVGSELRTRISDSFRSSKAFFPCKRPRELCHSPDSPRSKGFNNTRVPLAEIQPNFTPPSNRAFLRPPAACMQVFSNTCSPLTVTDEEFDDEILKEIDAICEQRSSLKEHSKRSFDHDPSSASNGRCLQQDQGPDLSIIQSSKEETALNEQDSNDGSVCDAYAQYFKSLNERQREAACTDISVPLMIVAGPGSGKTSTMVGRVLTLLKKGISPSNILAMTFTTAAASEMRDRIAKVTGKAVAKELAVSTFHSFCLQLCRSHAEKLKRTPEFLIYGHAQQRRAVIESLRVLEDEKEDACKSNDVGKDAVCFKDLSKKWQKFVTQAKASGRTSEDYQKMGNDKGAKILESYESILISCNALDYHDFISCSVKLLTEFPEVYKNCMDQWKAIVVDEFQDTSSMQYKLLQVLASHNQITVIGDDDQSIFSFNGADVCGFDSFRQDFPDYKEVRLCKNYRSTRCIVEAASSLIRYNIKRCQQKEVDTENPSGCKIIVKECYTEDAQCSFVIDKILVMTSDKFECKLSFDDIAILYRRQVTGRLFQMKFRERKIPFNNHGVAFYRKKVVRAVISILRTALPQCGNGPFRQAFKALLLCEKEVKKKIIDYVEKIASARNVPFLSAASDIFGAKISGTFKRAQLTQGRKVLSSLSNFSKLVSEELSISSVISAATNLLPQRYLLEKRAVIDVEAGKYLNEDHDLRSVLQYLLDDVAEFLSSVSTPNECIKDAAECKGCQGNLSAFLDYISLRETEQFRALRRENENSVTLTTIHQSKGLEWDTVFIVKVNDSEIPLLNELSCSNEECGTSLEEERRLMYVAMTRARKRLFILHILMDSNQMLLEPSRFLREIPAHLLEGQEMDCRGSLPQLSVERSLTASAGSGSEASKDVASDLSISFSCPADFINDVENTDVCFKNNFLKRFNVEERSAVSQLFHQWARKSAFQIAKRLLNKVGFVIDERLRSNTTKNKELLRSLKSSLSLEEATQYADYVIKWEKIPCEKRSHLMREKQEHFQKQRIEASMSSSAPSAKQISYLQSLGCTIVPSSRLHASHLIEQYKCL
ncbi:P-loop containing nucleoside triphosphate hydrolases superfamily protein [Wolffia australiana]